MVTPPCRQDRRLVGSVVSAPLKVKAPYLEPPDNSLELPLLLPVELGHTRSLEMAIESEAGHYCGPSYLDSKKWGLGVGHVHGRVYDYEIIHWARCGQIGPCLESMPEAKCSSCRRTMPITRFRTREDGARYKTCRDCLWRKWERGGRPK
jgi:hypothetical protein